LVRATYTGRSGIFMKLTRHISKRNIVALESTSKSEVITELATRLKRSRLVSDTQEVVDRVLERESLETTGIGRGVAIPHALCSAAKKLVCSVGICSKPVDFRSFDGKRVRLVFLIVYPSSDMHKYLHFVSSIARLFSESKCRKLMSAAKTADELYKAITENDKILAEVEADTTGTAIETDTLIAALKDKRVDLLLLTRLQRLYMLKASRKRPSQELLDQIQQLHSCIEPSVLSHFDKLMARPGGMAVVAVEGTVCQGCYMALPSEFIQDLRESDSVRTCPTCGRFIFDVMSM